MRGELRFCLWLSKDNQEQWEKIQGIKQRVSSCEMWRNEQIKSGDAFKLKDIPWSFRAQENPDFALAIPRVSSENREYVPMDILKKDTIIGDSCYILPEATNYDFAILTSRMHMCWMRLTAGRLKSDYRYSRDMTFNTFVWPESTESQIEEITNQAKDIRRIRARNSSINLGDLYNPDKMPEDLKEAHNNLDLAVERAYRAEPFKDDEERLSFLLELYSNAVAKKENK